MFRTTRGSALVLTVVLMGVLSFSIAVMLYVARNTVRSSRDKVDYEQTYQTALTGVQMAKSWMFAPVTAQTMFTNGSTVRSKVEGMTSCSVDLSKDIITTHSIAENLTAASMISNYFSGKYGFTAANTSLVDGRRVIYNFPNSNGKVLGFENDAIEQPTNSITQDPGDQTYVSRLRVTTPYLSGSYPDHPKAVSLIIESEARTISAGITKKRWVQEKILIYPQMTGQAGQAYVPGTPGVPAPTASSGAAIVGGGGLHFQGSSHANVAWGPAWSKGNIKLLNAGYTAPSGQNGPKFTAGNKLFISGAADPFDNTEKWLKWQAGAGAYLYDNKDDLLFPATINGNGVTDYMAQAWNGTFGTGTSVYVPSNGKYTMTGFAYAANDPIAAPAAPTQTGATSIFGAYVDSPAYGQSLRPLGSGILVQNLQTITDMVNDQTENVFNYTTWKNFAIARGRYIKPPGSGSQYLNDQNQPLYIKADPNNPNLKILTTNPTGATAFTNLKQISMINLVPSGGNIDTNPFSPNFVADQVLFLDTPEGTKSGSMRTYSLNSSDDFFWKGLLYVNGNLSTSGGGAFPSIRGKNPDEYVADPYGTTTGHMISNCYMDGILFVRGQLSRTGNAAIYGSVVAAGQGSTTALDGAGSPDVFYNTRNKFGLFQADPSAGGTPGTPYQAAIAARTFNIVGGATREMPNWPG